MTSVNTNAAAITALRTLQQTNQQLDSTQSRISTGLKIGEAKDNAAYWAISTTLKSDNKSLGTVKDALGLGAATVDVAYQGLNKAKDVLDEIKAKLTAATQPGVDRNVIQAEIGELQKQLTSIATSSVFSGENWLSVDSSSATYDATKKIVSSFSRDANNSVSIGTVDVAIGGVALFDASNETDAAGILDKAVDLKGSNGRDLSVGGTTKPGNEVVGGLETATVAGTAGNKAKVDLAGTVVSTVIDANDKITLAYTIDNVTSLTVDIEAKHVKGAGFPTQGTIGNAEQLARAVNNALAENGQNGVTAVVNGSTIALQRSEAGINKSVEITGWTGTAPTFASTITSSTIAPTTGTAARPAKQTIELLAGAGSNGNLTFDLDGTGTAFTAITGIAITAGTQNHVANQIKDFLNTDTGAAAIALRAAVTVDVDANDDIVLTWKTDGPVTPLARLTEASTSTGSVHASNNGTKDATTTQIGQTAQIAEDTSALTIGATGAEFDENDELLFQFDSTVTGGSTTTHNVSIKLEDLVKAGITDRKINSSAEYAAALGAAFTRQGGGLADFVVTEASGTLKVAAKVAANQTIAIRAVLTTHVTEAVTDTILANQAGLSNTATVARGTNATSAVTTATGAFPTSGFKLDEDDKLYFDVKVGDAKTSKLVTIDKATVDKALSTASAAKVTMGEFDAYGLTGADNIDFEVTWDGVGVTYRINQLDANSTAQDFADKINGLSNFADKGTASVENGRLVFTAKTAGAGHSVQVTNIIRDNTFGGAGGIVIGDASTGMDAVADAGGQVSNADQMARVLNEALSNAKVTGVAASAVNGRVSFTSAGTGDKAGVSVSEVKASTGATTASVDTLDISTEGLKDLTNEEVKQVLSAYIDVVNTAINKVTTAASNLGAVASRIDMQKSFVNTLMDTIDKGVGTLIDADMSEESTKLQALQVKQQLGVQALSIANQSSQNILSLFRG